MKALTTITFCCGCAILCSGVAGESAGVTTAASRLRETLLEVNTSNAVPVLEAFRTLLAPAGVPMLLDPELHELEWEGRYSPQGSKIIQVQTSRRASEELVQIKVQGADAYSAVMTLASSFHLPIRTTNDIVVLGSGPRRFGLNIDMSEMPPSIERFAVTKWQLIHDKTTFLTTLVGPRGQTLQFMASSGANSPTMDSPSIVYDMSRLPKKAFPTTKELMEAKVLDGASTRTKSLEGTNTLYRVDLQVLDRGEPKYFLLWFEDQYVPLK